MHPSAAAARQRQAYAYAWLTVCCWATVSAAFKIALRDLHYAQLLLLANVDAVMVLLALVLASGRLAALAQMTRGDHMRSLLLGLMNPAAYYLLLFQAYALLNSVKAMRGCLLLEPEGKLVPFAAAVFEAYWSRDRDISQDDVLADLCGHVGVEPAQFFQGIATPEIKGRLKANTDEVIARGGFGSPTIFVDGDDMYFGNDRLGLVREAVMREQRC